MIKLLALLSFLAVAACTAGKPTKDSESGTDSASLVDFTCGDQTCTAGAQYCLSESGGASEDTSDVPHCTDLPTDCVADLTCACLSAAGDVPSGGACTEDGSGGLFVTVNYA